MEDDTLLPFSLPAVERKKVAAAFDGGRLTSDGGVLLLSGADRQLGLCATLAAVIPDHRDAWHVTHHLEDILRARVFAIACGYPDADDLDDLRCDPAFKLACGRLPESGDDLASQPTISRWENAPDLRTLLRLGYAMNYAEGHLVSSVYRRNRRNNTPYFLIPAIVVAGGMYLVLPFNLFVVMIAACTVSFGAHVFLDKQYHSEGTRLARFAWFRRKQQLHFV